MAWFFSSAGGLVFFKHWPTVFLTFAPMYTEQELKKAADIIKKVAEDNNVSEDQVRADMQEAMDCGRNCPDPIAQKLWEGFHYAGSEPTLEEFILWVASLSQQA